MGLAISPDKLELHSQKILEARGEVLCFRALLCRVEGERDLLRSRAVLCQGPRAKFRFIIEYRHDFAITLISRVVRGTRAELYEWLREFVSDRAREDARLLDFMRDSYMISWGR